MRHSIDELTGIVYRHYPRGLLSNDPRYAASEQYRRLEAARRQAGADNEAWQVMLKRLVVQFPENSVLNRSLHLPTGSLDACYSACLDLPAAPGEQYHSVGFFVSFLVPYYVIYSLRSVDDLEEIERMKASRVKPVRHAHLCIKNTLFILPDWMVKILPDCMVETEPPSPMEAHRNVISFDLSPDEHPYGAWISQDIEATWGGYERMPPEVGKVIVPDVATNLRWLGEATLYDCLFSDQW
jgi:hypothetical protein